MQVRRRRQRQESTSSSAHCESLVELVVQIGIFILMSSIIGKNGHALSTELGSEALVQAFKRWDVMHSEI